MELSRLLDELTRAAERVGIRVRMESFDPNLSDARRPRGGLCTLRGRRVILVDAGAALPDRIATVAGALAQVDLDALYLPPIVRATIGAYAAGGGVRVSEAEAETAEPPASRRGPRLARATARGGSGRGGTRPLPPVRARRRDDEE